MSQRGVPLIAGFGLLLGLRRAYQLLTSGALTLDLGVGRRVQQLGPLTQTIAAPQEAVFDVIAAPYLGRTPRALSDKVEVWERGSDLVLAADFTRVKCGVTTPVETVRFQRPDRVDFRLVRSSPRRFETSPPKPNAERGYGCANDRNEERGRRGCRSTLAIQVRNCAGRRG